MDVWSPKTTVCALPLSASYVHLDPLMSSSTKLPCYTDQFIPIFVSPLLFPRMIVPVVKGVEGRTEEGFSAGGRFFPGMVGAFGRVRLE